MQGIFEVVSKRYEVDLEAKVHCSDATITIKGVKNANRALHGDTVEVVDSKITNIIKRSGAKLVGVFHVSDHIVYNAGRKFTPCDSRFPTCIVHTKRKQQSRDEYVTVRLERWNSTDQYPVGVPEHKIGNVGDIVAEKEYLRWRNGVRFKSIPNKIIRENTVSEAEFTNLTHLNCYSIDPSGCRDIDDALSLEVVDETTVKIGVHIADVSRFVQKESPLDDLVKIRATSVYLSYHQYNMLPDILSLDLCSLLPKQDRFAVSVIFTISGTTVVSSKFFRSKIHNRQAFSYEEAEELPKEHDVNIIRKTLETLTNSSLDAHKLVAQLMIMANRQAATTLASKYPTQVLLRSHKGMKVEGKVLEETKDTERNLAIHQFNVLNQEAAEYTVGVTKESKHSALGEDLYTHFTSPIRRYADIIVHRMLLGEEGDNVVNSVKIINQIQQGAKQAERESQVLQQIVEWNNENITEVYTNGYVLGWDTNRLKLYLPKFKLTISTNIYSNRVVDLVTFDAEDKLVVTRVLDKKELFTINLMDKLPIKIIPTMLESSFWRKLRVKLLEPDVICLLESS